MNGRRDSREGMEEIVTKPMPKRFRSKNHGLAKRMVESDNQGTSVRNDLPYGSSAHGSKRFEDEDEAMREVVLTYNIHDGGDEDERQKRLDDDVNYFKPTYPNLYVDTITNKIIIPVPAENADISLNDIEADYLGDVAKLI